MKPTEGDTLPAIGRPRVFNSGAYLGAVCVAETRQGAKEGSRAFPGLAHAAFRVSLRGDNGRPAREPGTHDARDTQTRKHLE